ncbi:hypothetical protein DP590_07480 [Salmonella enterica]|nr:hypothetical protein [Salmonella enterica]ECE0741994.1 hypothetical protein [Salmonella enterica subsp. enterica serovar Hvittingfoss]EGA8118253.1 hypothetical protein [Salmonella enterica]EHO8673532.1 hypothetical protein [Salmonella enterica]
MTRLTEIYNRLDAVHNLLVLQKQHFYHVRIISDKVSELIGYVKHVTSIIWERQRRHRLTDFEFRYILPALDEIYILMEEKLSKSGNTHDKLSDGIMDLIGLVGWWLLYVESYITGKVDQ